MDRRIKIDNFAAGHELFVNLDKNIKILESNLGVKIGTDGET